MLHVVKASEALTRTSSQTPPATQTGPIVMMDMDEFKSYFANDRSFRRRVIRWSTFAAIFVIAAIAHHHYFPLAPIYWEPPFYWPEPSCTELRNGTWLCDSKP
jgi:hypothetical protein